MRLKYAIIYFYDCKMNFSQEITQRRKQLKLSQIDLAEMSGVGVSTVKDIERGKGNPSLQTVEKLFETLGLEMVVQIRKTF